MQTEIFKPVVNLKWITPSADQMIADIARVSVIDSEGKPPQKLIAYLINHKHWSPFEMANMCVEIYAPRDITRQILRHGMRPQEFCIAGDSEVSVRYATGKKFRMPIKELYERQQRGNAARLHARVYDESSKTLAYAPIREVFSTGAKHVYHVSVGNGAQKTIKSTAEHKFLCRDGVFRPLGDISVGDFVALNGVPVYQSAEWMADAKAKSLESGLGLSGVAADAGCTTHTARKWLKRHGMPYTKKEVASYTDAWNKGLPPEHQPMFGKQHSVDTRAQMRSAARHGDASNLYSSGAQRTWVQVVRDECCKWKLSLVRSQNGQCDTCGCAVGVGDGSEIDHKMPISLYPEQALNLGNLHVLCKTCHDRKSKAEAAELKHTVRWGRVNSIEHVGVVDTFDLEVEHISHNYVANGIVVHNSQRYAEVTEELFCGREARMQHPTNRQMSLVCTDETVADVFRETQLDLINHTNHAYKAMLRRGIAKECARVILPEGLTLSRMFLNGNVRNWIHYLQSRTDEDTVQKEHVQVANAILELFKEHLPLVYAAAFPDAEGWTLHSNALSPTVEGVVRNAKDIKRYVLDKWPGTLTCRVSFAPAFGFCRIATTNSVGGTELWHDYTVISASTV